MTFWETVERGEYVMIPLAVLLIAVVCVWWVRTASLSRKKKGYADLMHRVRDHIEEGDLENARQLCVATDSPGARMVCAGVENIGKPMNEVRAAMSDVADIEKRDMNKGMRWLRAIGVITPLLGLGGTLVGMVDRLRDLGEEAVNVDTAAVCAALAPTIVTTVAGIGVGIFSLFALVCLEGSADSASRRLDEVGVEFTSLLNEPS